MILTITIARIVRTKGVDMFATTDTLVEMFLHTDGILDMFPHTADIHNGVSGHVETVCCLYHQKKDFIYVPYETERSEISEAL